MKLLRRLDALVARVEGALLVFFVLAIVLIAALQTFLRNALDSGVDWGDDALRWATVWIAFLGASLATHRGKHIAIDVASRLLPPRPRRLVAFLTSIAAAIFAGLLAWGSWRFVREIGSMEPPVLDGKVPRPAVQIVVPAAFALMALRFLLHAFDPTPPASPEAPPERRGEKAA